MLVQVLMLLNQNWDVKVIHMYREGNRLADKLASMALQVDLGYHEVVVPLVHVTSLLMDDQIGVAFPRSVVC